MSFSSASLELNPGGSCIFVGLAGRRSEGKRSEPKQSRPGQEVGS